VISIAGAWDDSGDLFVAFKAGGGRRCPSRGAKAKISRAGAAHLSQHNLGIALAALGARESGTTKLKEAVAAYREALREQTRERAPFEWALTQKGLGDTLARLGAKAGSAYREALKELTRERAPRDWAMSFGHEGVTLMALAERRGDAAMAEAALSQINTAFEAMRDGGEARFAEYYEGQLPKARALVARLRER
jgi:hypothetical protein